MLYLRYPGCFAYEWSEGRFGDVHPKKKILVKCLVPEIIQFGGNVNVYVLFSM